MESRTTKPAGNRRVTIKDVAAALGVAVSTVSNAYNRPDQLSAALRERVFETAERIGFAGPNPVARGLRTRSSGQIAVVLGEPLASAFADPIAAATLEGITAALSSSRFSLVLVPGDAIGGIPAADGAIVLSADRDDRMLALISRHGLPMVLVDHPQQGFQSSVSVDDEMAARGAMGHLTGLGHNRLAVIVDRVSTERQPGIVSRTQQGKATFSRTSARLKGYRLGAEAAGLNWIDVVVYEAGENTEGAGQAAAEAIFRIVPIVTGILATSDRLAVGVLTAAKAADIPVPDRLSVVGFDDSLLARSSDPPLTSVRQPHANKGRAAAEALLSQIRDEPTPPVGRMAPKIVIRGSSKAPAS